MNCDNIKQIFFIIESNEACEEERKTFATHLKDCKACQHDIAELRSTLDTYQEQKQAISLPENLREKVIGITISKKQKISYLKYIIAVAATIVFVAGITLIQTNIFEQKTTNNEKNFTENNTFATLNNPEMLSLLSSANNSINSANILISNINHKTQEYTISETPAEQDAVEILNSLEKELLDISTTNDIL